MVNFKNISKEPIRVIVEAGKRRKGEPFARYRNMKSGVVRTFTGLAIESARKDPRLQETNETAAPDNDKSKKAEKAKEDEKVVSTKAMAAT